MSVLGRNRQKMLRNDPELFEEDGILGADSVEDVLFETDKIHFVYRNNDLLDAK